MRSKIDETRATVVKFISEFMECAEFTGLDSEELIRASYTHFKPGPDINFRDSPTKIFDLANYNIHYMVNIAKTDSLTMAAKLMRPFGFNSTRKLPVKLIERLIPIDWKQMQFLPISRVTCLNNESEIRETDSIPANENDSGNQDDILVSNEIYNQKLMHVFRICFLLKSNQILERSCGFIKNPAEFPEHHLVNLVSADMEPHEWLTINKSGWIRDINGSLTDWATSLMVLAKKASWDVLWDFLTDIDNMKRNLKLSDEKFWRDLDEESLYISHLKTFIDLNRVFIGLLFKHIDTLWDRNVEATNDLAKLLEQILKRYLNCILYLQILD